MEQIINFESKKKKLFYLPVVKEAALFSNIVYIDIIHNVTHNIYTLVYIPNNKKPFHIYTHTVNTLD